MEAVLEVIWIAVGVYLAIGAIVAVYLHARVLSRLDASANGASIGFRVVVTPGLIALWPILLRKTMLLNGGANAHGSPEHPISPSRIRAWQGVLIKLVAIATPILVAVALLTRPDEAEENTLPNLADSIGSSDSGASPRAER